MQFVQFTETNDHEGETWHHWLQVDGNEDQLTKLWNMLVDAANDVEFTLNYELTENTEPEAIVDKLVEYADMGYMTTHTKVVGVFTCPATLGEYGDALYKGAITAHFTEVQ